MNRRDFLMGMAGFLAIPMARANEGMIPMGQAAIPARAGQEIKPYREVDLVYADRNSVLFGISFNCPHCRAYDSVMASWGASLPVGYLAYDRLPLVYDKPSMMAAAAYYAHKRAVRGDFGAVNAFMGRAFEAIQDKGGDMLDPVLWRKASGRPIDIKAVQDEAVQAARRVVQYDIKHSPSLVVGGRYVATPNDAGGRDDLFMQLANGLVSMALIDLGYHA